MTQAIASVASLFNVLSGATYFKQVIRGESIPNPATWLIWLVVTMMNTASYFLVVEGSFWVSLASMVLAAEILVIFLLALWKGKFTKLGRVEIFSLALSLVIGAFWKLSGNAVVSNLSLQAIFVISFYPTIYNVLQKYSSERSTPWFLAVVSYSLQIVNVFLSPVTLLALTFPAVNLIGNGVVGVLALKQRIPKP
jgi:hypothetical protein